MTTSNTVNCDRPVPSAPPANRIFHRQAAWAATFAALVGPLVLTAMAMAVGVPDALMGFVGVLPSLAGALTLVTAVAASRMNPRTATIAFVVGSRTLAAGLVLVPLLSHSWFAIAAFFIMALASLTLHAQATSSVNSWLLEFVPEHTRGTYNATRLTVTLLVTSAFSLSAGWLLDSLDAGHAAFSVILLLAAASAVPEVMVLRRAPHLPRPNHSARPHPRLRGALRDRRFMTLCAQVTVFYLALHISDSYTYAHLMGNLRLPATAITLFGLLGTVPQVLLLPWWGRRSDRVGHATVLRAAMLIFAVETLLWSAAGSGAAIVWVPAGFLAAAVANSAFAVAVFARRYELMPATHRVAYEAVFTAMTAVAFLAGPAIGALVRQGLASAGLAIEFAPVRGAYVISSLALVLLYVATGHRNGRRPSGRSQSSQ